MRDKAPKSPDGRCLCGECVGDGFDLWRCNNRCTHHLELIGQHKPKIKIWQCKHCKEVIS